MRFWILVTMQCALAAIARAQALPVIDTIAEARRLRDAGDFAGATSMLRPYVQTHPENIGSARFAALMAYWAKQPSLAESLYANALALAARDVNLRLEYGRFLVETRETRRAHVVLDPVVIDDGLGASAEQRARAQTLIGTAAYWNGDFTGARRAFLDALQADSSQADARRQLTEIQTASASWVRVGSDWWDDDQPLRSLRFDAEGAWYANPLTPLGIHVRSLVFDRYPSSESLLAAETNGATYLAAAHLDLAGAIGIVQRSFEPSTDWTAGATLGIRLPHAVVVSGHYDRSPYTSTIRSLDRATMVQAIEARGRFGRSTGWMGEVVGRRERYPDDNHVSTGFAWLLAPLWSGQQGSFHVGYGFAAASAAESRFQPRGDILVTPLPPGQSVPVQGEYNPYYTPRNLRVHSALANVMVHPTDRWSLGVNGRYGVSAHDDAPVLAAVSTPPSAVVQRGFVSRSFTPWDTRATVDIRATRSIRLGLAAERGQDAFYSFTTARVQLTYTFIEAAERRAGTP